MTMRTITFDDEQWQVVPKEITEEIRAAMEQQWQDDSCLDMAKKEYDAALGVAPEPPAQQRAMIPPGMWEFDALIDFIHEHGADSEGVKGMAERLVSAFMPPAQQPMTEEEAKALIPPVLRSVPAGNLPLVSTGYLIAMMRAVERHHGIGKGESDE